MLGADVASAGELATAVEAGSFLDLVAGPLYRERLRGTEECSEYCLRLEELRPCLARCECAYVRDVLQVVRSWKKLDEP